MIPSLSHSVTVPLPQGRLGVGKEGCTAEPAHKPWLWSVQDFMTPWRGFYGEVITTPCRSKRWGRQGVRLGGSQEGSGGRWAGRRHGLSGSRGERESCPEAFSCHFCTFCQAAGLLFQRGRCPCAAALVLFNVVVDDLGQPLLLRQLQALPHNVAVHTCGGVEGRDGVFRRLGVA